MSVASLSDTEALVLHALLQRPGSIEELIARTRLATGALASTLTLLEARGLVEAYGGATFHATLTARRIGRSSGPDPDRPGILPGPPGSRVSCPDRGPPRDRSHCLLISIRSARLGSRLPIASLSTQVRRHPALARATVAGLALALAAAISLGGAARRA